MYMVDEDKNINKTFGFTNQDGDIESVSYDECDEVVDIDGDGYNYRVYPQDIPKMIKALKHMHKYLVDEKLI